MRLLRSRSINTAFDTPHRCQSQQIAFVLFVAAQTISIYGYVARSLAFYQNLSVILMSID